MIYRQLTKKEYIEIRDEVIFLDVFRIDFLGNPKKVKSQNCYVGPFMNKKLYVQLNKEGE
jgi:hypothetical protein